MMNLVALITDTHLGALNDSEALEANQVRFFREQFFPTLDDRGVDTVIHLGDLLDRRKYTNNNKEHILHEEFLEPLNKRGIKLHVLVGNHDIPNRDSSTRNAQKIHVRGYDNFKYYVDPEEITIHGCKILLVPWITKGNKNHSYRMMRNSKARVAMTHLGFSGFIGHGDNVDPESHDPALVRHFDKVFCGHYHKHLSVGNIRYLNSICELSHGEDRDCRYGKGFWLWSPEKQLMCDSTNEDGLVEHIKNPHKVFHELVYDDTSYTMKQMLKEIDNCGSLENTYVRLHIHGKKRETELARFINHIEDAQPFKLHKVDHTVAVAITDDRIFDGLSDTLDILKTMVRGTETTVDKELLEKVVINLYNNAVRGTEEEIDI